MSKRSAGILMYRRTGRELQLFLVHPGGPFWARKDDGAWSIPKGLFEDGEDPLRAAQREFEEETGCVPAGEYLELGNFKQPSGKTIVAWGLEGDFEIGRFRSNCFSMEWPPKSGQLQEFPEADRAEWFRPREALRKVLKGQAPIITKLFERLGYQPAAERRRPGRPARWHENPTYLTIALVLVIAARWVDVICATCVTHMPRALR